ncbi:hypothetical protein COY17_03310 [Candidatus Saccharibacteria bacterium CG_4_10_14_0_2_um_filter_52_9]|nr:MAG: hypothetical protein COY17_03310 [Candidatus Saccharibacteria bacterium CG_4_10_14_0_2_um_filter_52_9]
MNRAVILHGTGGSPQSNWLPWLKADLENRGYKVWVPELPNNQTPNRQVYNDFLFNSGWDFADNLVVGHSSGAVSVLNLIEDQRCPPIKTGVLIGAWSGTKGTDLDKDQFSALFPPEGFNFELIKQKAAQLLFLHGDNDPLCPLEQAKWLAAQTASEIIIVPGASHFRRDDGFTELPQLTEALEKRNLL